MPSIQSSHIDNVFAVAALSAPDAPPDSLFHRSWIRCVRDHGLDPARPTPARIVPAQELRVHQQQLEHFLRTARAGMEDIYRRVADLGYMVLLTDADGITVDYIGNPASEDQLRKAGLYLGADWNEAHAGTCGVGTCLIEQTPLTCHQTEHFDATHIGLTCTTAPLFDYSGKLTAILDVSALRSPNARDSQHVVRHLVSIYARMIEDADFLKHFRSHWILRLGRAYGLVDVAGEVMLAFDDAGTVVGANSGARDAFAPMQDATYPLAGTAISDLLGMPMEAIWRLAGGASAMPFANSVLLPSGQFHASMLAPRVQRVAPVHPPAASRSHAPLDRLAGGDAAMQALLSQARRLVDRGIHVLVEGETGSGKEVLAKALHQASRRCAMPFVAVNCASIPESLIESELFGYAPGSFTGGRSKGMKGLIAQADRGTLFLDEIGDMPMALQTRLLRVLAEGELMPLGAGAPQRVDIAVIAATHRHLPELVAAGRFREDLYYRLRGAALRLPPLRERSDMRYVIDLVFDEERVAAASSATLSHLAMQRLLTHGWPGNVRELRSVLRLALALCTDGIVEVEHLQLPQESGPRSLSAQARAAVVGGSSSSAEHLLDVLRRHRWHVVRAAHELGVSRATVYRHMKRHGICAPARI